MAEIIKPIVRLFFLCEEAQLELEESKWILINPLHTVWMPEGITENFKQEELWAYVQFSGGSGRFYLSIHMFDEGGKKVGNSSPIEYNLIGGNEIYEEVFHLTNVPFEKPGIYELKVMGTHIDLEGGTTELRVLPGA